MAQYAIGNWFKLEIYVNTDSQSIWTEGSSIAKTCKLTITSSPNTQLPIGAAELLTHFPKLQI